MQTATLFERWTDEAENSANKMYAWLRASGTGVVTPSPVSDKGEKPISPSASAGTMGVSADGGWGAAVIAEGAPSLLDQLQTKYGSRTDVLNEAKRYYADDQPPKSLAGLSEARQKELLARV